MAWLRIDDGFASHPKIARLNDKDFRTWMRLLCYSARHKTEGSIHEVAVRTEIPGVTPAFLNRCYELHLLDLEDDEYVIHDWSEYNPKDPTKAERQARWRERKASTETSTEPSTPPSTEASTETSTEPSTSRARLPSRPPEVSNDTSGERPRDELWDALVAELGEPATKNEHGRRNAAVKQLRDIATTGDEVRRRCRAYRRLWPDITLTDTALVSNWSTLDQRPPAADVRQSVEEVVDLPDLSDDERQAYLERARALAESIGKPA